MKNDLRVTLTKRMLKEGLLRIMNEKPISKISVSELCKEAGVNRVTFYNHYSSPVMILREMAWDYADQLESMYRTERYERGLSEESAMEVCLDYLLEHKAEIKILFSKNAENNISAFGLEIVKNFLTAREPEYRRNVPEDDTDSFLYVITIASAAYGLISVWLTKDIEKTPGEIAVILKRSMINVFS